jgi:hypothetical protein
MAAGDFSDCKPAVEKLLPRTASSMLARTAVVRRTEVSSVFRRKVGMAGTRGIAGGEKRRG